LSFSDKKIQFPQVVLFFSLFRVFSQVSFYDFELTKIENVFLFSLFLKKREKKKEKKETQFQKIKKITKESFCS
jgi:hypothetical protein